jgi:hypothetical protein
MALRFVGVPGVLLGPFYRRLGRWRPRCGGGGARRASWGTINGAPAACDRRGVAHRWRGGCPGDRTSRSNGGRRGSSVWPDGGECGQQCRAWARTGASGGESGARTRVCALVDAARALCGTGRRRERRGRGAAAAGVATSRLGRARASNGRRGGQRSTRCTRGCARGTGGQAQGRARARGEGGGRQLAWRGAAGRACRSQAGGRRGKEERKKEKKEREKGKRNKGKERKEKGEGGRSAGADRGGDCGRSATRGGSARREEKKGLRRR